VFVYISVRYPVNQTSVASAMEILEDTTLGLRILAVFNDSNLNSNLIFNILKIYESQIGVYEVLDVNSGMLVFNFNNLCTS